MKKIVTLLLITLLSGLTFSQVTSTILLEEDFSSSIDPSVSSNQLNYLGENGFDGEAGSAELTIFDFPQDIFWDGVIPENTDSVIVTSFILCDNWYNVNQFRYIS